MRTIMLSACAACLATTASAAVAILDFESFNVDDPVGFVTFSDGTTATVTTASNRAPANGGTNQAVIFDTQAPTGNDDDLGGPFPSASGGPDLDPSKVLIIAGPDNGQGLPDDDAQGGTITFTFDRAVNFLGFNYFDTEQNGNELFVEGDDGSIFSVGPLVTGNAQYDTQDTMWSKVSSVSFIFGGSGAVDSLRIQAVPVPAALPLLLGALGMTGFLARRRSRS